MNKRKRHATNLNPRTSKTSEIGELSEERVLRLLKTFKTVSVARRDKYDSKFDIFYQLEGEDFTRGLQVKTISHISRDTYSMHHLNKYGIGMLIVAIHYKKFGILHMTDEADKDSVAVYMSHKRIDKSIYEKEIMIWPEFLVELEKCLTRGIIVTPEIFKNSVTPTQYLEYESIERFKVFCEKHKLEVEEVYGVYSPTDLIVNGFKIQMKFISRPLSHIERNKKNGDYWYAVELRRSGNVKYLKGDNDFYVVEMGEYKGEFLWIPEYLLLEREYISGAGLERARANLHVFPYDYVEKAKASAITSRQKTKIKGNWSCNKKYWFSTEKGCLGSTNDVATHIENLLIEEWIDWESPYEPIISK